MINSLTIHECDTCSGKGIIFYGDDSDYHIEPCECVAETAGI